MDQTEKDRESTLSDRISTDKDEEVVGFEPARLNLEARAVEL